MNQLIEMKQNQESKKLEKLTIYYDGSCPLCKREIALYQRAIAQKADFIDVSISSKKVADDLNKHEAMKRFHVRSKTGELENGAGAFTLILKEIPKMRWFGSFLSFKPIVVIADIFYDLFLKIRPFLQNLFHVWEKRKSS